MNKFHLYICRKYGHDNHFAGNCFARTQKQTNARLPLCRKLADKSTQSMPCRGLLHATLID